MCSPDAPDTSGVNAAAAANADIAREALDWYEQAYADQQPLRDQATTTAQRVADSQIGAMDEATRQARETYNFQSGTLRPAQQDLLNEARRFDTEQERERLAGLALGDVNEQFGAARDTMGRDYTRAGGNVSDGGYAAGLKQLGLGQALAGADAKNKSRQQSFTLGHALKTDAIAALSGLPANAATEAGIALNSGNSATANATVPVNVAQSGANMVGNGFNTAISGNNSSGNLYGTVAQIQNQGNQGNDWMSGLGNLGRGLGAMGLTFSDKKMKRDRKPMKTSLALAAARRMPVDSWKYKDDSPAADGGQTHIGPMAQDVHAAAGEKAAPGGKMLDLTTMNGITLAAVQHLDKNQRRMEKKVIRLADAMKARHAAPKRRAA